VPARRETLGHDQLLPSRGLEPCRVVARGPSVEVSAGEPFSLWGKSFDAVVLISLILRVFSYNSLFMLVPLSSD